MLYVLEQELEQNYDLKVLQGLKVNLAFPIPSFL